MTNKTEEKNPIFSQLLIGLKTFLIGKIFLILIGGVIGSLGSFLYISHDVSNDIAEQINIKFSAYATARETWTDSSTKIFIAGTSNNLTKKLPSAAEIDDIRDEVVGLINAIHSVPTPTNSISIAASNFRMKLSVILKELALYDGSPEAFTNIFVASQAASDIGLTYQQTIQGFLGSTYKRVMGSL